MTLKFGCCFVTGETVPVSFFVYLNSKLFRSPKLRNAADPSTLFRRAVGSQVIAATVEGVRIENLPMDEPVTSAYFPLNVRIYQLYTQFFLKEQHLITTIYRLMKFQNQNY